MKPFFTFLLSTVFVHSVFSQENAEDIQLLEDSTFIESSEDIGIFEEGLGLDPQRSALLSAVLPGLGQIYNKQHWKVPIIYGGLAIFGHFINYNNELYHAFRNAAIAEQNGLENPFDGVVSDQSGLVRNQDNFRRNRDYLIILGSIFYLLNVVDAHVSAHLDEFNVNEDLAISIKPFVEPAPFTNQTTGASLVIRLGK